MDLRVELNPQQKVIGATLRAGDSLLQVSAFAAPRAAGIWDDVRADIARTRVRPGRVADGGRRPLRRSSWPARSWRPRHPSRVASPNRPKPVRRPARFLGVDGPRWFLRGLISGPAAEQPGGRRGQLEEAFRGIVVVRGTEPMPVREQLPLSLPPQAAAQLAAQREASMPRPPGPVRRRPAPAGREPDYAGPVTETRSPGWLSRTLQRLTADEHTIDAEELRAESASAGCEPLSSCRKGEVVTVTGRLKSVVYTPRETVPTLEAELFDGSGSVTLVWLGRRRIPGIEPGRTVTARGRFAAFDGKRVIYNPWYELGAG